MDKAKSENISFEAALAELDTVLNALEKGDIPLEDALAQIVIVHARQVIVNQ